MKEAGYRLNRLPVSGLKGVGRIGLIRGIFKLPRSLWAAWGIVRRFRPTVVLGVGGYSSGPPVLVAWLAGVPTLLHESNAQPGITNRLLSPFCRKVATAFPECETFFPGKAVLTGTPVRPEFLARPTRPPERPFVLLIFGGSQGARAINRAVVDALEGLRPHVGQMHFIHQTGEHDFVRVEQAYREAAARALVKPFFTDMPSQFPKAHLVGVPGPAPPPWVSWRQRAKPPCWFLFQGPPTTINCATPNRWRLQELPKSSHRTN